MINIKTTVSNAVLLCKISYSEATFLCKISRFTYFLRIFGRELV